MVAFDELDTKMEKKLNRLIAEIDGVEPAEDVNVDYLLENRSKRVYPIIKFDHDSEYGGYDIEGLLNLSRDDLENLDTEADEFLEEI